MKCVSCEKEFFHKYSENYYIGLPVYRWNNCGLYVSGKNESEMIQDDRKFLIEYYREDVSKLKSFLDIDLAWKNFQN